MWDWQTDEIVSSNRFCVFESIVFSPLNFYLSFFNQIQENSKLNLPHLLDSILGLSIIDLDDINFKIAGLKLSNTSDTKEGLTSKILLHYQQSFLKNVFSTNQLFNLLGNVINIDKDEYNFFLIFRKIFKKLFSQLKYFYYFRSF